MGLKSSTFQNSSGSQLLHCPRHSQSLSSLGYVVTWAAEKKITLKKRSVNGRQEMTPRNSYNYCLSECLTAQGAGYRTNLLYFSLQRGTMLHDSELALHNVWFPAPMLLYYRKPSTVTSSPRKRVTLKDVAFIFLSAYFCDGFNVQ